MKTLSLPPSGNIPKALAGEWEVPCKEVQLGVINGSLRLNILWRGENRFDLTPGNRRISSWTVGPGLFWATVKDFIKLYPSLFSDAIWLFSGTQISGDLTEDSRWWDEDNEGFFFCFSKAFQVARRLQRLFFSCIDGSTSLVESRLVLVGLTFETRRRQSQEEARQNLPCCPRTVDQW